MANTTIQTAVKSKPENTATASKSINVMMNSMLDGEKLRGRFDELLGKRAPQFISSMVSMVNADPNLQEAFYHSPMTIIQSCLKAASFDLPIDQNLGYAYIVPFKNSAKNPDGSYAKDANGNPIKISEATFILGWKGMHQLALRTGVYKVINVTDVRAGELKSYNRLTEEINIDFVEDDDEREKLPVVGYVGYYRLINGAEKTIFMTKKQIENHELKFRKGKYIGKGWRDDFDAMARKTIYRKLIGKWGVMSIEYRGTMEAQKLADAISADNINYIDEANNGERLIEGQFTDTTDPALITDPDTGEVISPDTTTVETEE